VGFVACTACGEGVWAQATNDAAAARPTPNPFKVLMVVFIVTLAFPGVVTPTSS
jgi:hypothetical protein